MNESAVTALVSSRICHDLISPIGAISNGVELMTELGGNASPELSLICDSVSAAATKLRYFRIAFGAAPADAHIRTEEVRSAVSSMFGERFSVNIEDAADSVMRLQAKALLLSLLCLERSLPLGGQIIGLMGATDIRLEAKASRIKAEVELWALLDGAAPRSEALPAEVQFIVLSGLIREHGIDLTRNMDDGGITLTLTGF